MGHAPNANSSILAYQCVGTQQRRGRPQTGRKRLLYLLVLRTRIVYGHTEFEFSFLGVGTEAPIADYRDLCPGDRNRVL